MSGRVPGISCIVPAYNSEATLERAVISLLETGYPSLEIVIVNDGSTDATQTVAESLCTRFPSAIRVLTHPNRHNRGVSATRNLGIQASTGEWVCFLDADDTVLRHRFGKASEILASQLAVDGVYETAEVLLDDPSQTDDWQPCERFGLQQAMNSHDLMKSIVGGTPWATSTILIRRSLLSQTGGFWDQICVAEDCHLWLRMVAVGRIVPGELARPVSYYHRRSGSLYRPGPERKLDYFRMLVNFLLWMEKWNGGKTHFCVPDVILEVRRWLDNAFIQLRIEHRADLVRRLGWMVLRARPSLIARPRMISHLVRAHIE